MRRFWVLGLLVSLALAAVAGAAMGCGGGSAPTAYIPLAPDTAPYDYIPFNLQHVSVSDNTIKQCIPIYAGSNSYIECYINTVAGIYSTDEVRCTWVEPSGYQNSPEDIPNNTEYGIYTWDQSGSYQLCINNLDNYSKDLYIYYRVTPTGY